jgi:hypothetical protein
MDSTILTDMVHARIVTGIQAQDYHTVVLLLDELLTEHGCLSLQYQIAYCQSLYGTCEYLNCLEHTRRFLAMTPDCRDLQFICALCYYQLKDSEQAATIFATQPEWRIWFQKSQILSFNDDAIIKIGTFAPEPEIKFVSYLQTEDTVKAVFSIGGFVHKDISVEFGYDYVDLIVRQGRPDARQFSLELASPILAHKCTFHFANKGLVLVLHKRSPGTWKKLLGTTELPTFSAKELETKLSAVTGLKGFPDKEMRLDAEVKQIDLLGTLDDRLGRLCDEL